jgi:hypothetical protein
MHATDSAFELPEDGMWGGSNTQQESSSSRFVQGDDLHKLRQQTLELRSELHYARAINNEQRIRQLSRQILDAQRQDAEFMYQVALERLQTASLAGLHEVADEYRVEAELARSALPQFQLEGLWIGKYGESFQLINITYEGDVLIASKVTGDQHVPKGQVTFTVDLSPSSNQKPLDPIELSSPDAVEQWGSRYLQRHSGLGQVAGPGFVNQQWLPGQLILVNRYFSFAWLPTGHQVFFGRPSAELVLKLLRENDRGAADIQYLRRCLEETALLDDEMEVSNGIFRSHDQDYYYAQPGCFE